MCKHASPGPPHPASLPAGSSEISHPDGWWNWGVFLSVIKPFLWGKTHSDWLGLAPQWVCLAPKWVGICPPKPTHGYAPAQSCEIHRLGPNLFQLTVTHSNCWNRCMLCTVQPKFAVLRHVTFSSPSNSIQGIDMTCACVSTLYWQPTDA
jgi:hypothetical protein